MSAPPAIAGAVKLRWVADAIAVIALEDRASRNCASDSLIDGIESAFAEIAARPGARVVVMHGYDSYFCCGGTQEHLLSLAAGEGRFTDRPFYDLPFRCELPVIAAMQGHAVGGGLIFGAYADLVILAEECLYSANFMRYGFTPGMGATYILPRKLGATLAWEMLLTGASYHGGELRQRGAPVRIVPKGDVIPLALELAQELARTPLVALKELKRHAVEPMRDELAATVRKELEMHRVTFAEPEVRQRILSMYGG